MNYHDSYLILVVDDEEWNLDIIEDELKSSGFETALFNSPLTAVEALQKGLKPDLIISDIRMPEMNGFQFYEEVQKIHALIYTPFIFLTSLLDDETLQTGKELGADDYLTKPFKPQELISTIKGKLKKSQKISNGVSADIEKIKERILNTLSHELRTPITSMVGFAEILTNDQIPLDPEDIKVFSEMIKTGGDRLKSLVDDFFESVSIEIGETMKTYDSQRKDFDIVNLLNDTLLLLKKELLEKSLVLEKITPEGNKMCFGCISQIQNIIRRILSNAVKFSPENSKIVVRLDSDESFVNISISDSGQGMPENEILKIYDKFHQINREKNEQQGSGLGLYIAKKIADINRCQIICKSTYGNGTTFTVQIPRANTR